MDQRGSILFLAAPPEVPNVLQKTETDSGLPSKPGQGGVEEAETVTSR